MRRQITNAWRSLQEEFFGQLAMVLIFGVMGILLMLFIVKVGMAGEDERTWFLLGTVMAVTGCVMVGIILGMLNYGSVFNMMVSMGRTRKEFYLTNFISSVLNNLGIVAAILVLLTAEKGLGGLLYKEVERYVAVERIFLDPRVILGYVLGMAVLRMLLGALFLRFGNKLMWMIWGVAILTGVISKGITKAVADKNVVVMWLQEVGEGFLNLAGALQALIVVAAGICLMLLAWIFTKKKAVTA